MNLTWSILSRVMRHPRRIAVVDDQRHYSYSQIGGGGMFMAEQIDLLSDNPHVGIMLPTSGAFSLVLLGSWLARRVAVPLNYMLKPNELEYVIANSGIDTIVSTRLMLEFVAGTAGGTAPIPSHVRVVQLEEMDFSGMPPWRWPPLVSRNDLAVILYTSGTSGRPKGVMLTHGNLYSNAEGAISHAELTHADTFLGVLPQFHSFGLMALTLIPLHVGAKVVYSARFIPKRIMHLIRRHRPEIIMAIPSMYGTLLTVKEAAADDFRSIRFAISGGEPLPDVTFEAFHDRFGVRILEGYGLTETAPCTNWSTPKRFRRHSVGPALPDVDVRIIDENNRLLGPNQDGEIVVAGPNIMKGYYQMPEETAEVFTDLGVGDGTDGSAGTRRFFRTGDIGRIDEDEFLYITGRKKEMIIVGGENVFPREIEEVLDQHDAVAASAVIGRQDAVRGEVPIAFVEVIEGRAFNAGALRNWCRDQLAGYKVPREIQLVDHLPRSSTGKILRRELKAER